MASGVFPDGAHAESPHFQCCLSCHLRLSRPPPPLPPTLGSSHSHLRSVLPVGCARVGITLTPSPPTNVPLKKDSPHHTAPTREPRDEVTGDVACDVATTPAPPASAHPGRHLHPSPVTSGASTICAVMCCMNAGSGKSIQGQWKCGGQPCLPCRAG